jgi:hypothetical protein
MGTSGLHAEASRARVPGGAWLTLIMSRDPHGSAAIRSHRSPLPMEPVQGGTPPVEAFRRKRRQETTHPTVVVAAVQSSWRGCAQSLSAAPGSSNWFPMTSLQPAAVARIPQR